MNLLAASPVNAATAAPLQSILSVKPLWTHAPAGRYTYQAGRVTYRFGVERAYLGYQAAINTGYSASIRYGYSALNITEFGYNLSGGDGVIPTTPLGLIGSLLNITLGSDNPVEDLLKK